VDIWVCFLLEVFAVDRFGGYCGWLGVSLSNCQMTGCLEWGCPYIRSLCWSLQPTARMRHVLVVRVRTLGQVCVWLGWCPGEHQSWGRLSPEAQPCVLVGGDPRGGSPRRGRQPPLSGAAKEFVWRPSPGGRPRGVKCGEMGSLAPRGRPS